MVGALELGNFTSKDDGSGCQALGITEELRKFEDTTRIFEDPDASEDGGEILDNGEDFSASTEMLD